jgi:hypothetical protein
VSGYMRSYVCLLDNPAIDSLVEAYTFNFKVSDEIIAFNILANIFNSSITPFQAAR